MYATNNFMHIHIYYGSTRGNTHIVVSHLSDIFTQAGHKVSLQSVLTQKTIEPADGYIFACGTYGHGVLQEHMDKFVHKFNKNIDLAGKPCAAIGLGDDKYDKEYNMESAVILSDFIDSHNGVQVIEPLKINKSPLPHLHEKVQKWGEDYLQNINTHNE